MSSTFYQPDELKTLGLQSYGENVKISRLASILHPEILSIGSHTRIDDFCVLSGDISLGSYVHISAFSGLFGQYGITIDDHSGISSRVLIYSAIDDFSGHSMIGPQVPDEYRHVISGPVILQKHVQIGAGSIVLPNVVLEEGSVVGALSFVKQNTPAWTISAGIPASVLKERSKNVLDLELKLQSSL